MNIKIGNYTIRNFTCLHRNVPLKKIRENLVDSMIISEPFKVGQGLWDTRIQESHSQYFQNNLFSTTPFPLKFSGLECIEDVPVSFKQLWALSSESLNGLLWAKVEKVMFGSILNRMKIVWNLPSNHGKLLPRFHSILACYRQVSMKIFFKTKSVVIVVKPGNDVYQISEGSIDPCSLTFDKLQVVSWLIPFNSETRSVVYRVVFVGGSVLMFVVGPDEVAHRHLWGHGIEEAGFLTLYLHFVSGNQS